MEVNKADSSLNSLIEYMTISEIAFNVMTGSALGDNDMKIVYDTYMENHDELLRVLVNNFG
jgi:hypothetical protein